MERNRQPEKAFNCHLKEAEGMTIEDANIELLSKDLRDQSRVRWILPVMINILLNIYL